MGRKAARTRKRRTGEPHQGSLNASCYVAGRGKGVPRLEVMCVSLSQPAEALSGALSGGRLVSLRKAAGGGIHSIWPLLGRTAQDSLGTQALSTDATEPLHCHLADGSTM